MRDEYESVEPNGLGADPFGPYGAGVVGGSLCDPFVTLLPVTGASVSVLGVDGNQSTLCSSDDVASKVDELQFELGEGPHWVAMRTAQPVFIHDVRKQAAADWPMFAVALGQVNVGALFAIPLMLGAVVVGVVDLYRSTPGWLRPQDLNRALVLAASVTTPAVNMATRGADRQVHADSSKAPAVRRAVHQATGMIIVQLGLTPTEAFRRLKLEAFMTGRPIQEVAGDIVARRMDLRQRPQRTDPNPNESGTEKREVTSG